MRAIVLHCDEIMWCRDVAISDHFLVVVYPTLKTEVTEFFHHIYSDFAHAHHSQQFRLLLVVECVWFGQFM
jgi:hypothetical protein